MRLQIFSSEYFIQKIPQSPDLVIINADENGPVLSKELMQEGLEGDEVISLDNEIPRLRVAKGKVRGLLQKMKGHLVVVVDGGIFPDPI
jgi:hypothetical protein